MPSNGDRIRQARKLHRLTQVRLADLTGLPQGAISRYESNEMQPTLEAVQRIAAATQFPSSFFYRAAGPEIPQGSLAFRARRYASTKLDIEQAQAWTELLYECCSGLARRIERLPVSIPRLDGEPPEQAARIARAALGLSADRPIQNVTYALERAGVVVLALPIPLAGRDAFSTWATDFPPVPVAVVPQNGSSDVRFWLSHELKHLMDFVPRGYLKTVEDDADTFAAEFLMPEAGIADELQSPLSIERLTFTARRWGVTRKSVVMRAIELDVISRRRGQQLFRILSSEQGAQSATARREKPRLLRKMAEIAYGAPPSPKRLASDYDLPIELAAEMLNAHASRAEVVSVVPTEAPPAENVIRFRPRDAI